MSPKTGARVESNVARIEHRFFSSASLRAVLVIGGGTAVGMGVEELFRFHNDMHAVEAIAPGSAALAAAGLWYAVTRRH